MADRSLGQDALLYADVPGTGAVTVTVIDAVGTTVKDAVSATLVVDRRYSVSLSAITPAGEWSATWFRDGVQKLRQTFTVGKPPSGGLSTFHILAQAVARVELEYSGLVESSDETSITDRQLIAGYGSMVGQWVRFHPELVEEAGRSYLVEEFNGTSLLLTPELRVEIPEATPYSVTSIAWREAEQAFTTAMAEIGRLAKVECPLSGLSVVTSTTGDPYVVLPAWVRGVARVYLDGSKLRTADWSMAPERRLVMPNASAGQTVSVLAFRAPGTPRWDDSILDIDPQPIIAYMAGLLHARRARGSGTDADEHLRRQMAAMDEAAATARWGTDLPAAGYRDVLD